MGGEWLLMTRTREPRFALEPLLHAAGCYDHAPKVEQGNRASAVSVLAHKLGFSGLRDMNRHYRVERLKQDGLTWRTADTLACRLGLHPASVWGEEWWAVARDAERVA